MKKKRLIPVLLLKNGWIVQSHKFTNFKNLGNPITSVKRLSEWCSDELIYLDISKEENMILKGTIRIIQTELHFWILSRMSLNCIYAFVSRWKYKKH